MALQLDVPSDAWDDKHLAPPLIGAIAARRRGPAAHVRNEVEGWIEIGRGTRLLMDPAAYWQRLEGIVLHQLLAFERGDLDRDDYFAPSLEAEQP